MSEALRQKAAALIGSSAVRVVVGYREGRRPDLPVPHFAHSVGEASQFILTRHCRGGLAVFARREAAKAPAAFVSTAEDVRALRILVQEKQVPAENVRVIAFEHRGGGVTILPGERLEEFAGLRAPVPDESTSDTLARLRAMTPAQRWRFWRREFDKCVRCYACRQACPMCYCEECIAEKNLPQWIEVSPRARGNFAWNLIRAWHLAGRCVECGACERACPQGIRLMPLNRMLADEIASAFGYSPGAGSVEEAAFFATFKDSDSEDFILKK